MWHSLAELLSHALAACTRQPCDFGQQGAVQHSVISLVSAAVAAVGRARTAGWRASQYCDHAASAQEVWAGHFS